MIIGVDIGGTSIKAGLIDGDNIVELCKVPTDISNSPKSVFDSIYRVIDRLMKSNVGSAVTDIGISSAGDIDAYSGRVIYATEAIPGYTGQDIRGRVASRYNLPVTVMNDAMCATIGEMTQGAGKGYDNVMMLTLGTGVGGEVAIDGRIILGDDMRGSRLGHLHFREGRLCPCGADGCIEAYVSATGLLRTARERGLDISDCNEIFEGEDNLDIKQRVISEFAEDLARVVDYLTDKVAVDVVIIGGGLVWMQEGWWAEFDKARTSKVTVKVAKLGNNAGIIGAGIITRKIYY